MPNLPPGVPSLMQPHYMLGNPSPAALPFYGLQPQQAAAAAMYGATYEDLANMQRNAAALHPANLVGASVAVAAAQQQQHGGGSSSTSQSKSTNSNSVVGVIQ